MTSAHFLYKLIPPRPGFPADLNETEAAVMARHFAYWEDLIGQGSVLIYGPVADPAGSWGLAIVAADDEAEVRKLGASDPAVTSQIATFTVMAMPDAISR